jgi:hypothetical protein
MGAHMISDLDRCLPPAFTIHPSSSPLPPRLNSQVLPSKDWIGSAMNYGELLPAVMAVSAICGSVFGFMMATRPAAGLGAPRGRGLRRLVRACSEQVCARAAASTSRSTIGALIGLAASTSSSRRRRPRPRPQPVISPS